MHATRAYVFVLAFASRHYILLTATTQQHSTKLLLCKKIKIKILGHTIFPLTCFKHTHASCVQKDLGCDMLPHTNITQLSPFRHIAHLSPSTFTPHTPSHTHCIKPYLSVDLYTERSGSSQSSITAPSSRPCGFHDNRITMK